MSWEFFRTSIVTARKDHRCEQCRHVIPAGAPHTYCAGKFEGDFMSYREHSDCRAAWHELNFKIREYYEDAAPFMRDDECLKEDRAWLEEHYPVVAARFWPQAVPA
jgi:hypothetical protein